MAYITSKLFTQDISDDAESYYSKLLNIKETLDKTKNLDNISLEATKLIWPYPYPDQTWDLI